MSLFFKKLQIVLLPTFATLIVNREDAVIELTFMDKLMISSSRRFVFLALTGRKSKVSGIVYVHNLDYGRTSFY